MLVFKLTCEECSKTFGVAFLGISDLELRDYESSDLVLEVQEGPAPISADEVLDAHNFIKDLETGWKKFIEDNDNTN